jgi:hypothetical protein
MADRMRVTSDMRPSLNDGRRRRDGKSAAARLVMASPDAYDFEPSGRVCAKVVPPAAGEDDVCGIGQAVLDGI